MSSTFHMLVQQYCWGKKGKDFADENTWLLIDHSLQVRPYYIKTVYPCTGRSLATNLVSLPQGSSLCAHYNPHMRIICLLQKPASRFSKWKAARIFITLKLRFTLQYNSEDLFLQWNYNWKPSIKGLQSKRLMQPFQTSILNNLFQERFLHA